MRRLLATVLATVLAASVVHCSSAGPRETFDELDGAVGSSSSGGSGASSGSIGIGSDGGIEDSGPQVCDEDIDVVLVIDTSTTMLFVLDALEDEFENVVTAANGLKEGAHFGAVFFQDNGILDTSGAESDGKVHLGHETLRSAFVTMRDEYTRGQVNPGDGPDGPNSNAMCEENSLDALHIAATQFPWRPNAAHIVVVVTDDTFLEAPDNYGDENGNGSIGAGERSYPAERTVPETVAALQAANVKVFSFTNTTAACGATRRLQQTDAMTYGWSKPYGNNAPFPEQTGGANFALEAVARGDVHLDAAINDIVLAARCNGVN